MLFSARCPRPFTPSRPLTSFIEPCISAAIWVSERCAQDLTRFHQPDRWATFQGSTCGCGDVEPVALFWSSPSAVGSGYITYGIVRNLTCPMAMCHRCLSSRGPEPSFWPVSSCLLCFFLIIRLIWPGRSDVTTSVRILWGAWLRLDNVTVSSVHLLTSPSCS